jgi:hypothetical protein
MLGILPVLGVHAFEMPRSREQGQKATALVCHGKGIEATGFESSQGFVVKAGSQAVLETVPSMKQYVRGMYDLRLDLIESGVLAQKEDYYVFTQDYVFSSPSTAAAVVLGRSANGRTDWKDKNGRTLKQIQEAVTSIDSID